MRDPMPGGFGAALLTVALLAVGIALGPAAAASGTAYSGGVNPTYTGSGAEPVTESVCGQYSNGLGDCGFLTANADRFTISLPSGFVVQHQGRAAATVDNMAVIAAVVRDLNPAKYAPADQSVVPSDLSVSPTYAAMLATVGVTPTQFLDWMFANVPASERAPWVPGSAFSAPAGGAAATSAPAPPPASSAAASPSGTKASGGTTTSASNASAPKPSYSPPVVPAVYPTTTAALTPAQVSAEKASATASGTGGTGRSRGSQGVSTSSTVNPGGVIANPADCPAGESAAVEPQGAVCIPDGPLGVPLHPGPKPVPSVWTRAMMSLAAWLAPILPYWSLFAAAAIIVGLFFVALAVIRKIES